MALLPVSMTRSSSQPSTVSHYPRDFPNNKQSYCYCHGPTQRHEHHHYYSEAPPPAVIKMEPDFRYQGYQPLRRSDWTTTAPMTQQPIESLSQGTAHPRGVNQAADAVPAPGFHFEQYSSTYGNVFAPLAAVAHTSAFTAPAAEPQSQPRFPEYDTSAQRKFSPKARTSRQQPNHLNNSSLSCHSATKSRHRPSHFSISSSNYRENPNTAMSLSYESRSFMQDAAYPQMGMHEPQEQEMQHEPNRYPSPPMPSTDMHPYNPQLVDTVQEDAIENLPNLQANDPDAPSPGRSKPIPKPDREVTKGENGRFVCTWIGCTEEVRDFGRKCEWSKHMDKHDRPYKCPAEGCEKLPGFTYSGGLLRHEREVHGKHGGPRKQLNCPHSTCKRHTGKGFSRQENLNEHLRRVHTSDGTVPDGAETEDEGSDSKAGVKRKRGSGRGGEDDIRQELKRLRAENEELRRHSEAQSAQTADMMNQIRQLQSAVTAPHARMPNAPMM